MQEKIGKKENGKERKKKRNYFLNLCLVREKNEKKENRREIIFACLVKEKSEEKEKLNY